MNPGQEGLCKAPEAILGMGIHHFTEGSKDHSKLSLSKVLEDRTKNVLPLKSWLPTHGNNCTGKLSNDTSVICGTPGWSWQEAIPKFRGEEAVLLAGMAQKASRGSGL